MQSRAGHVVSMLQKGAALTLALGALAWAVSSAHRRANPAPVPPSAEVAHPVASTSDATLSEPVGGFSVVLPDAMTVEPGLVPSAGSYPSEAMYLFSSKSGIVDLRPAGSTAPPPVYLPSSKSLVPTELLGPIEQKPQQ